MDFTYASAVPGAKGGSESAADQPGGVTAADPGPDPTGSPFCDHRIGLIFPHG